MPIPEDFQFAPEVDDPATLPAELKAAYVKNEAGKYVLDPVLRKRLDTTNLNKALENERRQKKEFEKLVAGFKGLGLGDTPEEALAAIEAAKEDLDPDDPNFKKQSRSLNELRAKIKAEFDETLKKTVGEKDEQLGKMERSLRKHLIEKEAIAALAKHKGSQDLLLGVVTSRLGLIDDGEGNLTVAVVDKDGDPVGDGLGGNKSVESLVKDMRGDERYARAFDGTGKGGTGTRPGSQQRTGGEAPERKSAVSKISDGLTQLR